MFQQCGAPKRWLSWLIKPITVSIYIDVSMYHKSWLTYLEPTWLRNRGPTSKMLGGIEQDMLPWYPHNIPQYTPSFHAAWHLNNPPAIMRCPSPIYKTIHLSRIVVPPLEVSRTLFLVMLLWFSGDNGEMITDITEFSSKMPLFSLLPMVFIAISHDFPHGWPRWPRTSRDGSHGKAASCEGIGHHQAGHVLHVALTRKFWMEKTWKP